VIDLAAKQSNVKESMAETSRRDERRAKKEYGAEKSKTITDVVKAIHMSPFPHALANCAPNFVV